MPVNRGLCQAQPAREIGVVGLIGYLCLHRYSCPPFHLWKCSSINCCCSIEFLFICRFLWYTGWLHHDRQLPAMPIVPAIAPRGGRHGRPHGSGCGGAPGGQPSLHGAVPAVLTVQNHLHGRGHGQEHGHGCGAVQVIHPQPVSPPDIDM
ncbi:hypothetical protein EDD18DRAFT_1184964 [Armillaria luteobubalina]|uniref:Uncharacterized protein n=1 Tax=Armillaria luteobubalina TaxID=153913 RepID=A0AA39PX25_9AGAR|nr:hypothetical protein EDD18DRAFT_1184964 [Armillaria luteobubalina]